jgi:Predicted flavin-nucleotide-binding protein structurally related to pyridoxine 5''-phosphate oxidase
MSGIYADTHRRLQDRFETRRLADRLEEIIVREDIDEQAAAFIASRNMVFLSTITPDGMPTVSYKGGAPGFVRIVDATTLALPSYDGNGMYYSMGNLAERPEVGLLFIDFETPHRLRVHGRATIDPADPLLAEMPGAELVARIAITKLWINCPRYIHRFERKATSRNVPAADCTAPLAEWKRIDVVQDVLPDRDVARVGEAGGIVTIEDYGARVARGEG